MNKAIIDDFADSSIYQAYGNLKWFFIRYTKYTFYLLIVKLMEEPLFMTFILNILISSLFNNFLNKRFCILCITFCLIKQF